MSTHNRKMFEKLRAVANARGQSLFSVANRFSAANRECLAAAKAGARSTGGPKTAPRSAPVRQADPFPDRNDFAVVTGEIRLGAQADMIVEKLEKLRPGEPFNLFIESNGGDCEEAFQVYHALKAARGEVRAHVHGKASSAASLILLGATERTMEPDATIIIHDPAYRGAAADDTKPPDYWRDRIASLYARETNLSADRARELMRAETRFTARQALRAGFIHAITHADGTIVEEPMSAADRQAAAFRGFFAPDFDDDDDLEDEEERLFDDDDDDDFDDDDDDFDFDDAEGEDFDDLDDDDDFNDD